MGELMRMVLIQKLEQKQIFESSDGRLLRQLTQDELETELTRAENRDQLLQIREG